MSVHEMVIDKIAVDKMTVEDMTYSLIVANIIKLFCRDLRH
jgi:hypothetical protein